MYQFLLDAWATLRMRYKPQETYRYHVTVVVAILLALSFVNASLFNMNAQTMLAKASDLLPAGQAALSPIFASHSDIVVTAFAFTVLKWFVLTLTLQKVLGYYGAKNLQLLGFIFITEALVLPEILLFYAPNLAMVGVIWSFWTFFVQINGVVYLSGVKPFKVVIGYLAYFMMIMITGMMLAGLLSVFGFVDSEAAVAILELLQKTQ